MEKCRLFHYLNLQVILAHATHLYLDHAYEPDPDERGYYWATRYIDTYKVFGYMPDRFYDNADVTKMGEPTSKEEICREFTCDPLNKPDNIVGNCINQFLFKYYLDF